MARTWLRLALGMAVIAGSALAYQNCAQSFKTLSASQLTQQCKATVQANIREFKNDLGNLDCETDADYRCEMRVFSPSFAANSSREESLCFDTPSEGRHCVTTEIREFATGGTRQVPGIDLAEFEPGGEFNRSEARCQSEARVRGVAAFEKTADSVAEAFRLTRVECRKLVGATP